METGFLNFHDEEHFTSTVSPQTRSGLTREGSLFANNVVSEYGLESYNSWDQGFSVSQIKVEPVNEDYEKTFKEWNQHLKELGDGRELADILGMNVCSLTGDGFQPDLTLVKEEPTEVELSSACTSKDDIKSVFENASMNLDFTLKEDLILNSEPEVDSTNLKDFVSQSQNIKQEDVLQDFDIKSVHSPSIENDKDFLSSTLTAKQEIEHQNLGLEIEESCLEAGDVDTLLEQFEAAASPLQKPDLQDIKVEPTEVSENVPAQSVEPQQVQANHVRPMKSVWEICEDDIKEEVEEEIQKPQEKEQAPVAIQEPEQTSTVANKSIKDALPKEVIERIRESCKKRKQKAGSSAAASPQSLSADLPDTKSEEFSEWVEDHDYCWSVSSRRDSGLESGELSDSGGEGRRPNSASAQVSNRGEKQRDVKKKKLKLEEYRERRKNAAPLPPLRPRAYRLPPATEEAPAPTPAPTETPETPAPPSPPTESRTHQQEDIKPPMISVEVQTEVKKEEKLSEELQKKKEEWLRTMRSTYHRRSTSSSSRESSPDTARGRHRAKRYSSRYSRSRGRSKGGRSWSRSTYSSRSSSSSSSSRSSRSRSRSRHSSRHRRRRSFCKSQSRTRLSGNSMEEMGERRVVYVGQIEDGVTKQRLRDRFTRFGSITAVSLHFRDRGDNYGFVTFKRACDAYQAVEHGNDYGLMPRYDICFGGRRAFCKQRYADLDNTASSYPMMGGGGGGGGPQSRQMNSFDLLLREAQENLRKRAGNTAL